jgi:hypothetical protein
MALSTNFEHVPFHVLEQIKRIHLRVTRDYLAPGLCKATYWLLPVRLYPPKSHAHSAGMAFWSVWQDESHPAIPSWHDGRFCKWLVYTT